MAWVIISRNSQACRSGGPCFFSLYPHLYCNACAFFLWRE
ncbi:hypothetical protein AD05_2025 [Escherichia coli 5-366-08_S4_C2]|nr:hypothetical protein FORC31_3320 [Escherichia coli]EFJ63950.1 hypothetical protein HMPREF9547_04901 [Escherichia coli MS 175-1]EFK13186.1 hypothetical protein HMPREF9541_04489 [Escherichia coli MS 116-1]EMV47490.1 hypothetical protein ECBCE019MS13_0668 [Escherichia coli BCE019_MS-13]EMX26685.1 hypothetical protein ECMP0215661_1126 [Escherichia coli MP021566.1]ENA34672.1 hypothetical protein ECBCE007MS11_0893 [Escherichia coli BCE007_MS-11]ENA83661.1 hypothetical protein EC2730450_0723 [Esc